MLEVYNEYFINFYLILFNFLNLEIANDILIWYFILLALIDINIDR